ncbi:hypothetical protein HHI36_003238 [Cryptolaemus montrouzieri]|uniref:Uncharacterized protein n=1 Tax=Cryptolaemus montrouzieri TaxID=559131 RepID=A0ABD2PDB5_9CUCU
MKSIKPKPIYLFLLIVLQFSKKPAIAMVMEGGSGSISTTDDSCNKDKCLILCKKLQPEAEAVCSSTHIGFCECKFNIPCLICSLVCKKAGLEAECDEDHGCRCSVKPEVCPPWDCSESCKNDPIAKTCSIMTAVACLKYGPMHFCTCLCTK